MIYLDNASTTKVSSRVFEKMKPYFLCDYANSHSTHQMGVRANVAIESARKTIAEIIGADPSEILFTSGATESNNTILSIIKNMAIRNKHIHIFSSVSSHPSISSPIAALKKEGLNVSWISLKPTGDVDFDRILLSQEKGDISFISLPHVCSESGVVTDLSLLNKKLKLYQNTIMHLDVTQSIGKLNVDVSSLSVNYLSFSAHKFHGPKGVGVLYVRSGMPYYSFLLGGEQEENRRAGSSNTAGIVGMSEALVESISERLNTYYKLTRLKQILIFKLKCFFKKRVIIHGNETNTTPYIILFTVLSPNMKGYMQDELLYGMDIEGICISTGTACSSGSITPSPILKEMTELDENQIKSTIRVSFSRYSTYEDVDFLVECLKKITLKLDA